MTAAVGRLLRSLCVHDDDDDGRNPLNASPSFQFFPLFSFIFFPFFLLNVHIQSALDRSALVHIVRTTKMQDGWTDNGSIETLYIDFSCLPPSPSLVFIY